MTGPEAMTAITKRLNAALLTALGDAAVEHTETSRKPIVVTLKSPTKTTLCVYMYSLVGGLGTKRPYEYKAVLRVPGQQVGEYAAFAKLSGADTLLAAYHFELGVFVLWDADLHPQFKNGGNIQVAYGTVQEAAIRGHAHQTRRLSLGQVTETVIVCLAERLNLAIGERLAITRSRAGRLRTS